MLKLLICLGCGLAVAVATLQLRQQELELQHRAAKLQGEIEGRQARLWEQQRQIAIATAPNAVPTTVAQAELSLTPAANLPAEAGNWVFRKPQESR